MNQSLDAAMDQIEDVCRGVVDGEVSMVNLGQQKLAPDIRVSSWKGIRIGL